MADMRVANEVGIKAYLTETLCSLVSGNYEKSIGNLDIVGNYTCCDNHGRIKKSAQSFVINSTQRRVLRA